MKPKQTERHLASLWAPPDTLPHRSGAGAPILCVASTYTFHANFLESDLLPRFLGMQFDDMEGERPFILEREEALGKCRVAVLVDAGHIDAGQSTLRWDQIPIFVPGGVQHAKVTLLAWEGCVRILVGSANLTTTGYRRNREVASAIDFFNHASSAPRQVAYEVIEFLQHVLRWGRGKDEVMRRIDDRLGDVRQRLGRWSEAPQAFGERERPRVHFVPGYPRREGKLAANVLDQAIKLWGSARADEVTVLTPFLGAPDSDYAKLIEKLRELPTKSDAEGYLAVPRQPRLDENDEVPRIGLPKRFLSVWAQAWGKTPETIRVWAVPPSRDPKKERVNRELHAKAVCVMDDSKTLLLCGSSNFSPHGMGVGAYNIEANLCYIADVNEKLGKRRLDQRLPVEWDVDEVKNARWDEDGISYGEDEDTKPPALPALFQWATYDQKNAQLTFGFREDPKNPKVWSISLPGSKEDTGVAILASASLPNFVPEHSVTLPEALRKAHIVSLRVTWHDEAGNQQAARLPVQVLRFEDLLPPSELVGLTSSGIVDCLIAGRSVADLAGDESGPEFVPGEKAPHYDPLKHVNTGDMLLYRMRRLGYALGVMGQRILKVARTQDGISYRLNHDPLGPRHLAEALVSEHLAADQPGEGEEALVFAINEICLVVGHAGAVIRASREAGEPDFAPLFAATIDELKALVTSPGQRRGMAGPLSKYARHVDSKVKTLIG